MPLCITCKKQYPFGSQYCPCCGNRLVIGELKLKPVSIAVSKRDSDPIVVQKEIIKEIEVIYCSYCGTKNNARLTRCSQCGGSIK